MCVPLFDTCLESHRGWKVRYGHYKRNELPLQQTQHKCLQTLGSIFAHRDVKVASTYIHELAPKLMTVLRAFDIDESATLKNAKTEPTLLLDSLPPEGQVALMQECTRCLEALIAAAPQEKRELFPTLR